MKDQIEQIKQTAIEEIKKSSDLKTLGETKVKFLGKKGELTSVLRGMGALSPEERPVIGSLVNEVRDELEKLISEKESEFKQIELNKKLIVADVYELGEENMKYGMYLFTELFWDKIKINRKIKKAIYLDEIWRLIGVTSNKEVAKFIYKIFKTIRKYGGSSVAITQDISDLFSLENGTYGKSILNNSSIKTFFSLEEENIKLLSQYSNLSEKEKIEINSLRRGECLSFVGDEHILINIEANDFEKEIIEEKKEE